MIPQGRMLFVCVSLCRTEGVDCRHIGGMVFSRMLYSDFDLAITINQKGVGNEKNIISDAHVLCDASVCKPCYRCYWVVMAMLIALGVVFVFWAVLFSFIFKDPYVGVLCSVFATGFTIWAIVTYSDKKKASSDS